MNKIPGRSTCCKWFSRMFSASIAVATIQWDAEHWPEFCISSEGTKYNYQDYYAQALHTTAKSGQPLTICLGTSVISDETCGTTVELSNSSIERLSRAAAIFDAEKAPQIDRRHLVAIRADHANNAYKGKKNFIEKQRAADEQEALENGLDSLSPMERKQRTGIIAWGCSDHKVDNAAAAALKGFKAFWTTQEQSPIPPK